MHIRIGTRKSKLALIQTDIVIDRIKQYYDDLKSSPLEIKILPIVTTGDKIQHKNLYDIGGKALFLKELEEQLLNNKIDIAVHSMKDIPGVISEEFSIGAVLPREDPRDALISYKYKNISELPRESIVGTSSVRRKTILSKIRPDLNFVPFRGNIHTRLKKLNNSEVDATILAVAGLKRAGLYDEAYAHPIDTNEMLPAPCQGIIAVQHRARDKSAAEICAAINCQDTMDISSAERSLMTILDASCRTPMSAYAEFIDDHFIRAKYMLSNEDGRNIRYTTIKKDRIYANKFGVFALEKLRSLDHKVLKP